MKKHIKIRTVNDGHKNYKFELRTNFVFVNASLTPYIQWWIFSAILKSLLNSESKINEFIVYELNKMTLLELLYSLFYNFSHALKIR